LTHQKDVSTTAYRCSGTLGMYEWAVMPFGSKNTGTTYQKVRKVIASEQNAWNKITVYSAKVKSRKP